MSENQRQPVLTAEDCRALGRQHAIQAAIHALREVETDLKWIWHEIRADAALHDSVATAISAVATTTRTFRQALGRLERGEAP